MCITETNATHEGIAEGAVETHMPVTAHAFESVRKHRVWDLNNTLHAGYRLSHSHVHKLVRHSDITWVCVEDTLIIYL